MTTLALRDISADELLTSFAVQYEINEQGYLHNKVFTVTPVPEPTGFYWEEDFATANRIEAQRRAPGTDAVQKSLKWNRRPFALEEWALREPLPKEHKATKLSPDDEEAHVQSIVRDLFNRREQQFFANFMQAGIWSGNLDFGAGAGTQWNAVGPSIYGDVVSWLEIMKGQCGSGANIAIASSDVFNAMKDDSDILDRYRYVAGAAAAGTKITPQIMADLFDLEAFYVADARYNSAGEDEPENMVPFGTDFFGLFRRDDTQALRKATAGRVFSWTDFDNVKDLISEGGGSSAIRRWYDEGKKTDMFEGNSYYEMHVVSPRCGYFVTDLLS